MMGRIDAKPGKLGMTCTLGDPEEATHANGWRVIRRPCGVPSLAGAPKLLRRELYKVATRPLLGGSSRAYLCDRVHMFDPRPLRIAIQALGGRQPHHGGWGVAMPWSITG